MTKVKQQPCSICGKPIDIQYHNGVPYWKGGHNAWPINAGQCCTNCNDIVVLPVRIAQLAGGVKK